MSNLICSDCQIETNLEWFYDGVENGMTRLIGKFICPLCKGQMITGISNKEGVVYKKMDNSNESKNYI